MATGQVQNSPKLRTAILMCMKENEYSIADLAALGVKSGIVRNFSNSTIFDLIYPRKGETEPRNKTITSKLFLSIYKVLKPYLTATKWECKNADLMSKIEIIDGVPKQGVLFDEKGQVIVHGTFDTTDENDGQTVIDEQATIEEQTAVVDEQIAAYETCGISACCDKCGKAMSSRASIKDGNIILTVIPCEVCAEKAASLIENKISMLENQVSQARGILTQV